jgi:hypothetical protein
MTHTGMEKISQSATTSRLVADMAELGGREIGKKNICPARRFTSDFLWYVSDAHVNGIGCLIPKDGELGFVGGYDEGNNRSAWMGFLNLLLHRTNVSLYT